MTYTQHRDTQEVLTTLDKLDIDDEALNNQVSCGYLRGIPNELAALLKSSLIRCYSATKEISC